MEILSHSSDKMGSDIGIELLPNFAIGLDLLDRYDHKSLAKPEGGRGACVLTYDEARKFVASMRFSANSELFGGVEAYPSVQEKSAILLYMIVKDHAFIDGNKRIAAALFVHYLNKTPRSIRSMASA